MTDNFQPTITVNVDATNPGQLRMSLQGINLNVGRRILVR